MTTNFTCVEHKEGIEEGCADAALLAIPPIMHGASCAGFAHVGVARESLTKTWFGRRPGNNRKGYASAANRELRGSS